MLEIFVILAIIFCIGLAFGGKDKPSKLPSLTKHEAEQYYKDFDYWNKKQTK